MAGKCKACNSKLRGVIESRLAQGESVDRLSAWLRTQGVSISGPSLTRHRTNHMDLQRKADGLIAPILETPEIAPESLETGVFIDTDRVMAEIEASLAESNVFDSVINERKRTQILMERIVQKQLVIVHELQEQYTEGKSGYPDAQIRGLKTLLDIVNSLPTYSDKHLLGKIERSGSVDYSKKYRQSAKAKAEEINATYKPWMYLMTDFVVVPPTNEIERDGLNNFPVDEHRRQSWINARTEEWSSIFEANINDAYLAERRIEKYLWRYLEDYSCSEEQEENFLSGVAEKLMKDYSSPVECCEISFRNYVEDYLNITEPA